LAQNKEGVFLLSKNGIYGLIGKNGNIIRKGNFPAGQTGEKFDFVISGDKWLTAHNGYSKESSAVAFGAEKNAKRITWADYKTYPQQSDDTLYPSAIIFGKTNYIESVFEQKLRIQMIVNNVLKYKDTNLPSLGDATKEDRCPPRLAVTKTGVVAVWKDGDKIMLVDVAKRLQDEASPIAIASGSFPSVAVTPNGKLIVVFIGKDGVHCIYR
jgi:hypothetical protein